MSGQPGISLGPWCIDNGQLDNVKSYFLDASSHQDIRNRAAARSFRESIESIFMSWSGREIIPGPVPSEINKKGVLYMFVL